MKDREKIIPLIGIIVCILVITTVFLLEQGSAHSARLQPSAYNGGQQPLAEGITVEDIVVEADSGYLRYTLNNSGDEGLVCGEVTEIEVCRENRWYLLTCCGRDRGADAAYINIAANSRHTIYQLLTVELPSGEYRLIKKLGLEGGGLDYLAIGVFSVP